MPEPVPLKEARAQIGHLVDRAEHHGETTVITRHGRPVAVISPYVEEPAMANTVTLYETNSDVLVIARGDQAWSLGAPSGGYLLGTFAKDALGWVAGDWAPCEAGGQTPTTTDGLKPVAEWDADGVKLLVYLEGLGAAARTYLGKSLPVGGFALRRLESLLAESDQAASGAIFEAGDLRVEVKRLRAELDKANESILTLAERLDHEGGGNE